MSKIEEWRDVKGYEGSYMVSDLGAVRSLARRIFNGSGYYTSKEKILSATVDKYGYETVGLSLDGDRVTMKIHQLVAIAFLDHAPCGMHRIINHRNGVRSDNRAVNLEVVTNRENLSTCYRKNEGTYSSIYVGVSWDNASQKWVARIYVRGVSINLGFFSVELDASNAYQEALLNVGNPEYFESIKPKLYSKYRGITYQKRDNLWIARLTVNGIRKYIGSYDTEMDAKVARDAYKEAQMG